MAAGPAASFLSWGCQSTAPCRAQRRGASESPPSTSAIRVRSDFHQTRPLRALQPAGWLSGRFVRCRAGVSQTTCAFRPCRSSRLRRLAPRITLRACCIPQPTMGFVPFPDSSGRPGVGHGDQPCHPRCFRQGSFPRDARPFEAFPLYAAILRVRCDRNRALTFR
jgi:hypothetical protein